MSNDSSVDPVYKPISSKKKVKFLGISQGTNFSDDLDINVRRI